MRPYATRRSTREMWPAKAETDSIVRREVAVHLVGEEFIQLLGNIELLAWQRRLGGSQARKRNDSRPSAGQGHETSAHRVMRPS